jgi:hypothetical protein
MARLRLLAPTLAACLAIVPASQTNPLDTLQNQQAPQDLIFTLESLAVRPVTILPVSSKVRIQAFGQVGKTASDLRNTEKGVMYFLAHAGVKDIKDAITAADPYFVHQLERTGKLLDQLVQLLLQTRSGPQESPDDVRRRNGPLFELLVAAYDKGLTVIAPSPGSGNQDEPSPLVIADAALLRHLPPSEMMAKRLLENLPPSPWPREPDKRVASLLDFLKNGDAVDLANAIAAVCPRLLTPLHYSEILLIKMVKRLKLKLSGLQGSFEDLRLRTGLLFGLLSEAYQKGVAVIIPPEVRHAITERLLTYSTVMGLAHTLSGITGVSKPETTQIARAIHQQGPELAAETAYLWDSEDAGLFPWGFRMNDVSPETWLLTVREHYAQEVRFLERAPIVVKRKYVRRAA